MAPPEATPETQPSGLWPTPRATRWWVAGLMLLAFVVRLIYVLETRANPYFDAPVMDPAYHVDWARAFAAGSSFQEGPFFRAPLYPWFLGSIFKLFGENLLLARLLQCVLGSLTTLLVYAIGRDAFDRRVGLLAALGASTYWVLVYFDGELLIPTLAIPLDMLALWLTIRLGQRPRPKGALVAGLAWGLAAIARPNVLLLMPVLFFWLVWSLWKQCKQALLAGAALTLGTLLPILPISLINASRGDFALIATQAGVNFWIGNNPDHAQRGDVSNAIVPGTRPGWWEGYFDSIALAEEAAGHKLKASEVSGYYSQLAWDWIFNNPRVAWQHWLLKLRLFWSAEELGNNQPVRGFATLFGPITKFLPLGFSLVAPLGLLGLVLVLIKRDGTRARLLPLWSFLIVYTLSVTAFFVNSRFRLPVIPVLLILAAHSTLWMLQELRARRFVGLGPAAALVAGLAYLSLSTPDKYRQDYATTAYQLGAAAINRSDFDAALEFFDEAIADRPTFAQAHLRRAMALSSLGRPAEAEAGFRDALEQNESDRETLSFFAEFLLSNPARAADALAIARRLVKAHPTFVDGYYHLGRALGQTQQTQAAADAFRSGLERAPGDIRLSLGLGNALGLLQRYDESAAAFQTAFDSALQEGWGTAEEQEKQSTYWRTAQQLFQVLHYARRFEDAQRFLEQLQAQHPGDPRVAAIRASAPERQ